jgi:hypothetical protein
MEDQFNFDSTNNVFYVDPEKSIMIDGKLLPRTPDPDRNRRLKPPTDKPSVWYCNRQYYMLNTAKLQAVDDLTMIVGIKQSTGIRLLKEKEVKDD